jgi:hypothetical protein
MTTPAKRSPDVDALARRLPRQAPSPERSQALRRALLDAARPRPSWWRRRPARGWVIGVGGLAAAACVLIALRTPGRQVVAPGRSPMATTAADATDHQRPSTGAPPSETPEATGRLPETGTQIPDGVSSFAASRPMQLVRGGATIAAPPGARFDVEVRDDEITRVTVKAGWVVIATSREAATTVLERHTWTPPITALPPAAQPVAVPGPSDRAPAVRRSPDPGQAALPPARPQAPRVDRPSTPPEPAPELPLVTSSGPPDLTTPAVAATVTPPPATVEHDFHDGLRALLARDARAAVGPLERACAISSSTQDDICYWASVASQRAGDLVRARASFADALARWPHSTHAGEANVALGWLLLDNGDRAGARARFAAAADDRMPAVRAEAIRGLDAAR